MHPQQFPAAAAKVQELHNLFERLTGNKCTLSYQRLAAWHEFVQRGLTADDLTTVIRYVRSQMGRQNTGYSPASLQFSRLILDTDLFEDRLNLARSAYQRATGLRPQPPAAPAGWADYLRQKYPDATITTWEALPQSVRDEVRSALR